MRDRLWRKNKKESKASRRLSEIRQHYVGNSKMLEFFSRPDVVSRYGDTPKACSCWACRNLREFHGPTLQERKTECDIWYFG